MALGRVVYVVVVILLGVASISANAFPMETGLVILFGCQSLMQVLTFPLGFIASLFAGGLIYSGVFTPLESLLFATPLFAGLGYWQWFHLLPRIYGRAPDPTQTS
ncbi:hypothetical protein [Rhizobium alvei]|uniref:Uncharacterized protein n=1 Tax=Rhizobium alvei TaxID=1132659 RepID=A0ABT8YF50_9HYPH|nr:hypothetical protein [Rhizobium alvei]MDO6962353.1 hypothetical protein [Rhizobium alvei]